MAAAPAAAPALICIDLDREDDSDAQPMTKVPQSQVKQEGCLFKGQEQQAELPSVAVGSQAVIGNAQEAVTPAVVNAAADACQQLPESAGKAAVQQQLRSTQAAALTNSTYCTGHCAAAQAPSATTVVTKPQHTTSMAAAAAAAAAPVAAVSDDADQEPQLPIGFTLSDCDDDIMTAGRQLTKLLRHLKAPKEQMVQLNACINRLRSADADQTKLRNFWYDYDQLQFWVERGDDAEINSGLKQLLYNTRRGASC